MRNILVMAIYWKTDWNVNLLLLYKQHACMYTIHASRIVVQVIYYIDWMHSNACSRYWVCLLGSSTTTVSRTSPSEGDACATATRRSVTWLTPTTPSSSSVAVSTTRAGSSVSSAARASFRNLGDRPRSTLTTLASVRSHFFACILLVEFLLLQCLSCKYSVFTVYL